MPAECERTLATVSIVLGKHPDARPCGEDDVDAAFRHLKLCRRCGASLGPTDLAQFVNNAILVRE